MPWKLKTAEDGTPELQDGVPVYVDETGKESPIDPNTMRQKILTVNAEAKQRRETIEAMQKKYAPLDGIEDIEDFLDRANKALDTVKNLGDAELVQAGEVEKIKADAKRGMEEVEKRLKDKMAAREAELQEQIKQRDERMSNEALLRIVEMPTPATEEPGTVEQEHGQHCSYPQPIYIVSSFFQNTSSFEQI